MQPHRGRLSINAPTSFGLRLLPKLLSSFRLAYPSIELSVMLTDSLVDVVAEDCDLAIRLSEPPRDKSTIRRIDPTTTRRHQTPVQELESGIK
ncbi:LysR substrate-binding domain-containing protein [Stappia taiwanensis]|uniref:LysR substrate-binding domain-containing protein n=1 Tax=Stappia taiwanensis TaxID=992267 RepID=UPI001AD93A8C|nr:LysR substrate-binding domain-containing protein [Stappia taiwanensis]